MIVGAIGVVFTVGSGIELCQYTNFASLSLRFPDIHISGEQRVTLATLNGFDEMKRCCSDKEQDCCGLLFQMPRHFYLLYLFLVVCTIAP